MPKQKISRNLKNDIYTYIYSYICININTHTYILAIEHTLKAKNKDFEELGR